MKQVTFYIIPHTHWDREWYLPFQKFRMSLVNLCRILTEYMEQNQNYVFTFDGQSIILDDVDEIEQELYNKIKKLASENRLIFGPWFVQADEFLVSGESLTRNLFIGMKKAKKASNGNFLHVGYAPDLFGHVPQLGEIFNQYGINHLIFWRGVPPDIENSEFYWVTPSGRKVLVTSLFQSYSNGLNLPSNLDQLEKELELTSNSIKNKLSTPNYLLMNGTDHELPQISLGEVFKKSQSLEFPDFKLKLATLGEYSRKVLNEFENQEYNQNLSEIEGELRSSYRAPILSGILSARMYLKKENAYLERLLEDYLIPLNSVLNIKTGEDYSENINFLLEKLIENHSHDCICGCSVDEVHEEMEQRFKSIKQMGNTVLEFINLKFTSKLAIQNESKGNTDSQISIVNPHSYEYDGILPVYFEPRFITNTESEVTYDPLKAGIYQIRDILSESIVFINFEQKHEIIIKDYAIGTYHISRLEETIKNLSQSHWFPVNYRVEKVNNKSEFIFEFSKRKTNRIINSAEIEELFKDLKIDKNEFIRVIFKSVPMMQGKLQVNNLNPFSFTTFSLLSFKEDYKKNLDKESKLEYGSFNIDISKGNNVNFSLNFANHSYNINNLIQFEDLGDRGDEYNFCPLTQDNPIHPLLEQWTVLEKNSMYLNSR
ncbi:MAG: glycoside hydrolase family 38 N-terminal domain-containing protein [Candidatus Hodarchaeales archaeon]|jgi:hypothetical protein